MTYEIHLTHKCNFKCPSCCVLCDVVNDPTSDLTMDEVKDIVNQINAIDNDIHNIRLGGGEPTLHPKCLEIFKYIKDNIPNAHRYEFLTNHTNNGIVNEIYKLGYTLVDHDKTDDPAKTVKSKAQRHWNIYLSPKEENLPISNPACCFALTDTCGVSVHKWRGKLAWSWCPVSPTISKLLRKENFMKPTLDDLFISNIDDLYNEICVHCHYLCRNRKYAIHTLGQVSNCFKEGLEEMQKYNEEVNNKH